MVRRVGLASLSFLDRLRSALQLRRLHALALRRDPPSIRRHGKYMVIHPSESRLAVADALSILTALDREKSELAQCLKSSEDKKSYRLARGGRTYFVKDYRPASLFEALTNLSRISLAAKSLFGSEVLRAAGIDTPRVECVLERRRFIARRSVLIAEFCDFPPLERYADREFPAEERGALARTLARLVARLHERGLFHRDLTSSNLLVRNIDGRWQIHLVDLDSFKLKQLSLADRVENLAQLNCSFLDLGRVTVKERLLFLEEYLLRATSLALNSKAARRKFLVSILERSRRMAAKPGRHFYHKRVPAAVETLAKEHWQDLKTGTGGTNAG